MFHQVEHGVCLVDVRGKIFQLGERKFARRAVIGGRGDFFAALGTFDEKIFAADFATGALGVFACAEIFERAAVGARHAERIFFLVERRLIRIAKQTRRLVVQRASHFVALNAGKFAVNFFSDTLNAVVGEVAIALEDFGGGLYLREKIGKVGNLERMRVLEAVVVAVENLRLRKVKQSFNRLPLRNRRGEFFCGVAENFVHFVGVGYLVEFGRRLLLIFQVERQFVQVENIRRPREIFFVGYRAECLEIFFQFLKHGIRHEEIVQCRQNFLRGLCRFDLEALFAISRLDCRAIEPQFFLHLPNLRLIDLQRAGRIAALNVDIQPQFFDALPLE